MEHFAIAHQLDENDKVATECINYLETHTDGSDTVEQINAKEFYTKALSVDPEFIKAC